MNKLHVAAVLSLACFGAARAQNVVTYHNSNDRHGAYHVPGLTLAAAATMKFDSGFSGTVSGHVYAQPLYFAPSGGTPLLIVPTENNIVTALNATTGATVWQTQLAAAAALKSLPCGDVDPEGITGTPVIDAGKGVLYLNALTAGTGSGARQLLYAISLANGAVLSGWPIDLTAQLATQGITFDSTIQGERAALLLFEGHVYIPFGGKAGDCGSYHGTVIEMDTATAKIAGFWATTAVRGGIWSQGGVSSQGKSMFVTTGNTSGATSWGEGEAIIRLKPGLAQSANTHDYFTPSNWQTLDNEDADLGGTAAIPISVPRSGKSSVARMLALGKDGNAYLANQDNLGGIGGQLAILSVSGSSIITGSAVYESNSSTDVAFTNSNAKGICTGNTVMMLGIEPDGKTPIHQLWCAAFNGRGAPIVTTSSGDKNPIVWVTGAEGDNELHGFDAKSGAVVFGGAGTTMTGLHRFSTLIGAGGRLYVAGDSKVFAFTFTP